MTKLPTKWTPEVEGKYLGALAATGAIVGSADAAGISVPSLYKHRAKDAIFEEKVQAALTRYGELLEKEAHRRAVEGVDEPVFYQGEECGAVTKYSDGLLSLMLKRRIPEYREKSVDVTVNNQAGVLVVNATPATEEEWREKIEDDSDRGA